MTPRQALAFVRKHGVVLESANGDAPSLAAAIAGKPIKGNWWSHPMSREIFSVTRAVRDSDDILVCRLSKGRITYVHRRLWPALVRAARRFPPKQLAQLKEVHTSTGAHRLDEVPFPDWVPADVQTAARRLTEEAALHELGET